MSKIKDIPIYERPYEKLKLYGEESLNDSELLSIIIKNGTKNLSAIEIAQKLISTNAEKENDLSFLKEISINDLMKIEGIGRTKAIEFKAICELIKRIDKPINEKKLKINSSADVANLLMHELKELKHEVVKLLMLNNKNTLQKIKTIAIGCSNSASFDIKQLLSEPVKLQIPKIIVVHNHPSGDPTPSKTDIEFTKQLYITSKMLGIELVDHVIIGDGIYKNIILKG